MSLYVFGRREDLALQKARSTINERIHTRLWLTPYTFESRRLWIGQVSRDIGVRLTDQTWNLTTHKIGPDVDFDRGYLLQDLLMSGFVERYGFVDGVRAATISAPRTTLTGDPYYTDGLRAVVLLSDETKPVSEIERLPGNCRRRQEKKHADTHLRHIGYGSSLFPLSRLVSLGLLRPPRAVGGAALTRRPAFFHFRKDAGTRHKSLLEARLGDVDCHRHRVGLCALRISNQRLRAAMGNKSPMCHAR